MIPRKPIPEIVKDYLEYDPHTGLIRNKVKRIGGSRLDGTLGSPSGDGYLTLVFFWQAYRVHRVAWFLFTGTQPPNTIDHINGNRQDNRWENLREASQSENVINSYKYRDLANSDLGVSFDRTKGKWRARLPGSVKQRHIGHYPSKEEARLAVQKAVNKKKSA